MKRLTLEVIATSVRDAVAAEQGGADRLELVVDLPHGGMTPGLSLVDEVLARVGIPVRVMVRETEEHEVPEALKEGLIATAQTLSTRSIDGLVFGALRNGDVDVELTRDIALAAAGKPLTFHRAFEAVRDPLQALSDLQSIGAVDRILTSGGTGDWTSRAAHLERWTQYAAPRIGILVGGGITGAMLPAIAAIPGIREVHVGRAARSPETDRSPVDTRRVRRLIAQLEALAAPYA